MMGEWQAHADTLRDEGRPQTDIHLLDEQEVRICIYDLLASNILSLFLYL